MDDWLDIIEQFSDLAQDGSANHIVCLIQVDGMVEFEKAQQFVQDKPAPISAMFIFVQSSAGNKDLELE